MNYAIGRDPYINAHRFLKIKIELPKIVFSIFTDCDDIKMDSKEKEFASLTLKSLANHFNIDRIKKYGSIHQPLPSKFKLPRAPNVPNAKAGGVKANPNALGGANFGGSTPSLRSAKIRPQLNPNARKMAPKSKRCKASALLDQIPVCKLQKTLIKYGCCHNMMQNVISLDYFEYNNDDCC